MGGGGLDQQPNDGVSLKCSVRIVLGEYIWTKVNHRLGCSTHMEFD